MSMSRRGAEGIHFAVSVQDVLRFLAAQEAAAGAAMPPAHETGAPGCSTPIRPADVNHDLTADAYFVDRDCDGRPEAVFADRDGDGRVDAVVGDRDQDGAVDYRLLDADGDGRPELWLIDENGDELADVAGLDLDGDGGPDTFRLISKH